jgi:hypothetical protein
MFGKLNEVKNLIVLHETLKILQRDKSKLQRFETTVPNFVFLCVALTGYFSFLIIWSQSVVVEIKLFAFGYVLSIVVLVFVVYKFLLPEEDYTFGQ